jgi:hypothetical protein
MCSYLAVHNIGIDASLISISSIKQFPMLGKEPKWDFMMIDGKWGSCACALPVGRNAAWHLMKVRAIGVQAYNIFRRSVTLQPTLSMRGLLEIEMECPEQSLSAVYTLSI